MFQSFRYRCCFLAFVVKKKKPPNTFYLNCLSTKESSPLVYEGHPSACYRLLR